MTLEYVCQFYFTLAFFSTYWFVSKSEKELKINFTQSKDFYNASVKHIFFNKYFGFSMGIAPTIICLLYLPEMSLKKLGFSFISDTFFFSLVWTIGLSILGGSIGLFFSQKAKKLINYPRKS